VVHRLLVLVAVACCTLVAVSFALFARDQIAGASQHQQHELASSATAVSSAPADSVHQQAQPRRFIDGAARALTAPFRSLVESSSSQWVLHLIPTLIGLLVYGVGLGYLARYSSGRA
jgi:hypothetical protein